MVVTYGALVDQEAGVRTIAASIGLLLSVASQALLAAGHGPVFGGTTPTLGKGGWSLDTAWTLRTADDADSDQMLKSMLSYGITEKLQVSASLPIAMSGGQLPAARMMSLMSNEQELEVLAGYRFQRRVIGVGGRRGKDGLRGMDDPVRVDPWRGTGVTVDLSGRRDGVRLAVALRLGWRGRPTFRRKGRRPSRNGAVRQHRLRIPPKAVACRGVET